MSVFDHSEKKMLRTVIFDLGGVYFSDGIFSHVVKRKKPDPIIYQLLLDKALHPANACVYIDDKAEYLEPAKNLGMQVIAFKDAEQLEARLKKLALLPSQE